MTHPPNHYMQCAACGRYCLARRLVGSLPNGTPMEAWCHAPWYAQVPTRKRPVPGAEQLKLADGTVTSMTEYATVCSLECAEWLFAKGELAGWSRVPIREPDNYFPPTRYFVGDDVLAVPASLFTNETPPEHPLPNVWRVAARDTETGR